MDGFIDDIRLSTVVMRHEITKHIRGKKLLIYAALIGLVLGLITVALVVFGDGLGDDAEDLGGLYTSLITLILIIGATLFGATTVVSEFEERTALIIFTRPIKKWSIFTGKFLAAFLILALFTVVMYIFIAILCAAGPGYIPGALWESLGYAICYCFGVIGVAMVISSLMKKSSTASILTFFMLALLLDMVVSIVAFAAGLDDTWYMLNSAARSITSCFGYYPLMTDPIEYDGLRDALVMIVWGIVPAILGYLRFSRKDF